MPLEGKNSVNLVNAIKGVQLLTDVILGSEILACRGGYSTGSGSLCPMPFL
jgi:hypothetical protein